MPFVVILENKLENGGLGKYYAGRICYYTVESVAVPSNTDDLELAKKYKYRTNAEKAVAKIISESSYVEECSIEEI